MRALEKRQVAQYVVARTRVSRALRLRAARLERAPSAAHDARRSHSERVHVAIEVARHDQRIAR